MDIMTHWHQYRPELVTDLYEFTMAASYWEEGMNDDATFSLFIRDYPPHRAFFVAAGLETLIDMVLHLRFESKSIEYLASLGMFSKSFLDYLADFHFSGSIRAVPEGRVIFAQEPLLEISAPLIEGQLLETLVLNTIHLETMLATKAARCIQAAQGRPLVDFALRRTHGVDAGVKNARSSYIVGFLGTSNVLAGKLYGIPVYGTMAHSYVTSFGSEKEAFLAYAKHFPDNTVLLVDTYDTLVGTQKAIDVAKKLSVHGKKLKGVRLDSGDLTALSKEVRQLLQRSGCADVAIMVSGNIDEYRLEELLREGAEIDAVGIGTRLGVSADAPYLDIAYKLVEYSNRPILKLSPGKETWVGRKQIWRYYGAHQEMSGDWLGLQDESPVSEDALLKDVVLNGERIQPQEELQTIRERFQNDWKRLPEAYRSIRPQGHYPVKITPSLMHLQEVTRQMKEKTEIEASVDQ